MRRAINRYGAWGLGLAVVACAAALGGAGRAAVNTVFPSVGTIAFTDCCNNVGDETGASSTATPYPSTINVSINNAPNVNDVNVTVTIDHAWPDDVDLLLVGPAPNNVKVLLMSDAGGDAGNAITPDTLVFDDSALGPVGTVESGTYKPSNSVGGPPNDCDNQADTDAFPAGPPAGTVNSTLAAFNTTPTNGAWRLYAVDDCNLGNVTAASITSWSLDITPSVPTNVTLRSFAAKRATQGAVVNWRTAVEGQLLGFNVYRLAGKTSVRVNKAIVAAKAAGTSRGATYKLADKAAKKGKAYTYRLQAVDLTGKRIWLAKAALRAR